MNMCKRTRLWQFLTENYDVKTFDILALEPVPKAHRIKSLKATISAVLTFNLLMDAFANWRLNKKVLCSESGLPSALTSFLQDPAAVLRLTFSKLSGGSVIIVDNIDTLKVSGRDVVSVTPHSDDSILYFARQQRSM